jgi:hypothetical protein
VTRAPARCNGGVQRDRVDAFGAPAIHGYEWTHPAWRTVRCGCCQRDLTSSTSLIRHRACRYGGRCSMFGHLDTCCGALSAQGETIADELCDNCLVDRFGDLQVLWPGDGWQAVRARKTSALTLASR